MSERNRKRLAWVAAVAGIALAAPYVMASAATKWPNSAVARFNAGLHPTGAGS